jgi:putative ubiquitin-RnfH superfamily antitoxin RatB of RatAB toxin-antitoxin module
MVKEKSELSAIEVVYATTGRQHVVELPLEDGLTALGAVMKSGLLEEFPGLDSARMALGVWGRRVRGDEPLHAGDRVEVYRPLRFDPRAARREAARATSRGKKPRHR